MGLLKAARGGVIDDLSVDWGAGKEVEAPVDTDDDFEIVSEPSDSAKKNQAQAQAAQEPLDLFGDTVEETKADLGPQNAILNLSPPPTIQQAPKSDKLPIPLYPGFRCSIFAIIKQANNPGPHSPNIKITGKVLGREVVLQIPVNPITIPTSGEVTDAVEGGRLLHTLAAKALIQSWEDLSKSPENKAQIERLGKRYTLASSVTSFLAIDEDEHKEMEIHPQEDLRAMEERELNLYVISYPPPGRGVLAMDLEAHSFSYRVLELSSRTHQSARKSSKFTSIFHSPLHPLFLSIIPNGSDSEFSISLRSLLM
jgi:hypothetical protein